MIQGAENRDTHFRSGIDKLGQGNVNVPIAVTSTVRPELAFIQRDGGASYSNL